MTREDLIKLARLAVAGIHRPDDCANPVAYDPPEWVLEALGAAWRAGAAERAADFADVVGLVAFIEALPCFEVTDHEVLIKHEIDIARDGTGVSGAMFLQAMRDWMNPRVPSPTPSSEKRTQRMKRKR